MLCWELFAANLSPAAEREAFGRLKRGRRGGGGGTGGTQKAPRKASDAQSREDGGCGACAAQKPAHGAVMPGRSPSSGSQGSRPDPRCLPVFAQPSRGYGTRLHAFATGADAESPARGQVSL